MVYIDMKAILLHLLVLSFALSPASPAQSCREVVRDSSGRIVGFNNCGRQLLAQELRADRRQGERKRDSEPNPDGGRRPPPQPSEQSPHRAALNRSASARMDRIASPASPPSRS